MCYISNCSAAKPRLYPAPQRQRESCAWDSGCIKPWGPGPELAEVSGKLSTDFNGLWLKPYLSYSSQMIYETVSVEALKELDERFAFPATGYIPCWSIRLSQKWVALNWRGKIPYVIEAQGIDFFQQGKKQMPPAALCLFLGSKRCSLEQNHQVLSFWCCNWHWKNLAWGWVECVCESLEGWCFVNILLMHFGLSQLHATAVKNWGEILLEVTVDLIPWLQQNWEQKLAPWTL